MSICAQVFGRHEFFFPLSKYIGVEILDPTWLGARHVEQNVPALQSARAVLLQIGLSINMEIKIPTSQAC